MAFKAICYTVGSQGAIWSRLFGVLDQVESLGGETGGSEDSLLR
jgi:hypothetical protein